MAFTLAFFSSVRLIVIDTARTKTKNVIRWSRMTDDFCAFITNPRRVNNVCVSEIFSRHSLVSLP